jgi:hypothetical protein
MCANFYGRMRRRTIGATSVPSRLIIGGSFQRFRPLVDLYYERGPRADMRARATQKLHE